MLRFRVLSAAVLIPLVAVAVYFGGWAVTGAVALVTLVMCAEFYRMLPQGGFHPFGVVGTAASLALVFDARGGWSAALPVLLAVVPLGYLEGQATKRLRGKRLWAAVAGRRGQAEPGPAPTAERAPGLDKAVKSPRQARAAGGGRWASSFTVNLALTLAGVLYLGYLMRYAILLRDIAPKHDATGISWCALALLGTWGTDTGAYFAGRAFGRHPFFPEISPKKTVEGAIGGLAVGVLAGLIVGLPWLHLAVWQAIVVGLLVGVAAITGDLVESLLKRGANVKDSGTIVPGHGGLLDRMDSLLFVLPVVYWFAGVVMR